MDLPGTPSAVFGHYLALHTRAAAYFRAEVEAVCCERREPQRFRVTGAVAHELRRAPAPLEAERGERGGHARR